MPPRGRTRSNEHLRGLEGAAQGGRRSLPAVVTRYGTRRKWEVTPTSAGDGAFTGWSLTIQSADFSLTGGGDWEDWLVVQRVCVSDKAPLSLQRTGLRRGPAKERRRRPGLRRRQRPGRTTATRS